MEKGFDFDYEFSHFLDMKDEELGNKTWSEEDLRQIAEHFFTIGKLVGKNQEDPDEYGVDFTPIETTLEYKVGFSEGKKREREQLLKDAEETYVVDYSSSLEPRPQVTVMLDPNKFASADVVKVVVIKEEKK